MNKRYKKWLVAGALFLILFLCVVPYLRVELNTYLHKNEFQNEFLQTHMIDEIEYLKVFHYKPDMAQVLYVVNGHKATIMTYFLKSEGSWKLDTWKVLWSATGSAESFFWPYYK